VLRRHKKFPIFISVTSCAGLVTIGPGRFLSRFKNTVILLKKQPMIKRLLKTSLLCCVGFSIGHASALTNSGLKPVPAQGPIEPSSGQILSGTTGTASGSRSTPVETKDESHTEKWWNGKGLLQGSGNPLFDGRKTLEEHGLKFNGSYQGAFFGVVASEKGSRGFWNQQINFGSELNFGKLLNIEALEGTTAFGNFRYRDPYPESNPNEYVEANSMFNPSNWQSGTQFRVTSFGLQIGTENLLPIEDMVTLRAGWLQPQREFIDQPLSKLFLNNAVNSAKGVGGNIPFGSSVSTWGGTLNVQLHDSIYLKNGLFMSMPEISSSTNHGLAYRGFAPDTDLNDQMLYREPSAPAKSTSASDGKSFKEVVSSEKPKLSKQGLSSFNLITMAPGYARSNNYPFYFQTGLVYTGLIPSRDKDITMLSLGYGAYQGDVYNPSRSYTAVLEGGYRFQINGWSYVQPFFQYFSRPNGTEEVANAAILGFLTGLVF
jgi:hypothetical protein